MDFSLLSMLNLELIFLVSAYVLWYFAINLFTYVKIVKGSFLCITNLFCPVAGIVLRKSFFSLETAKIMVM